MSLKATVFTGREPELATLKEMIISALRGRGGMAFIEGEAGVGKSRLAEMALSHARDRHMEVIYGKCLFSEGGRPYMPFIDGIQRYLARRGQTGDSMEMPMGLMVMEDRPGDKRNYSFDRDRLFENVSTFFGDVARDFGVAFLLEDIHLADASTLSLLLYLLKSVPEQKIFLAGTYRLEGQDGVISRVIQDLLNRIQGDPAVRKLVLDNLPREDAVRIMNNITGHEVSPKLAEWVFYETGGNPHFIEMVMESFQTEGLLSMNNPDLTNVKIPQSVSAVIARRFEKFSENEKKVLDTMAVIGTRIDYELLLRTAGLDEDTLVESVDRLLHTGIICEEPDGQSYQFTQNIYLEVIYGQMGTARRKLVHGKTAESIKALRGTADPAEIFSLARHFGAAGESPEALRYSRMAGDISLHNYAFQEALEYYHQALVLIRKTARSEDPAEEMDLLNGLGEVSRALGNWSDAMVFHLEATDLAVTDSPQKVRAFRGIGQISMERNEWKDARKAYEKALETAQALSLDGQIGDIYNSLAWIEWKTGNHEGVLHNTAQAKTCALRAGDKRGYSVAEILLGNSYGDILGLIDKPEELYRSALVVAESCGDVETMARAYNNLGYLYSMRKDYRKAVDYFARSKELAEKMGSVLYLGLSLSNTGRIQVLSGELDDAISNLQKAVAIYRKIDHKHFIALACQYLGNAYSSKRDYGMAEKYYTDALRIQDERGLKLDGALTLQQIARMWRERGDREKARDALLRAKATFTELKSKNHLDDVTRALEEL